MQTNHHVLFAQAVLCQAAWHKTESKHHIGSNHVSDRTFWLSSLLHLHGCRLYIASAVTDKETTLAGRQQLSLSIIVIAEIQTQNTKHNNT